MTQAREPHDGLRCEFLRQFHAALVGCTIGFIEIDVGQLLRAAQRPALDRFDFRISRLGAISVGWRQERRGQGSSTEGQELLTLGGVQLLATRSSCP